MNKTIAGRVAISVPCVKALYLSTCRIYTSVILLNFEPAVRTRFSQMWLTEFGSSNVWLQEEFPSNLHKLLTVWFWIDMHVKLQLDWFSWGKALTLVFSCDSVREAKHQHRVNIYNPTRNSTYLTVTKYLQIYLPFCPHCIPTPASHSTQATLRVMKAIL